MSVPWPRQGDVTEVELTDALALKQSVSEKGEPSGYAALDADGRVLDGSGNPVEGSGAVDSVNGETGVVVLDAADVGADPAGSAAAAQAASQPVDSDLTAIAALSTTAFGRGLLALADAAAGRTALGLGTAATHAHGDYDAAGAAAAAQAASQPLDSDLTALAALATTSFGRSLLELANAAAGRTALDVPSTAALAAKLGLPTGGTAGQSLVKQSATDGDAAWNDTASLSNTAPLAPATAAAAGVATDAARSDHQHPLPPAWGPQDSGFLAWTHDPVPHGAANILTAGYIFGSRIALHRAITVSNVVMLITTAGATLGASRVGIYSLTGTLIAKTADQATNWTSTGLKTMALTAESGQSLTLPAAGVIVVANVATATTPPQCWGFADLGSTFAQLVNANTSSPAFRFFENGTTFTALPSPLGLVVSKQRGPWFGLT